MAGGVAFAVPARQQGVADLFRVGGDGRAAVAGPVSGLFRSDRCLISGGFEVMDRRNLRTMVNLTGGRGAGLKDAVERYDKAHPGRFVTFTEPWWSRAGEPGYPKMQGDAIEQAVKDGARGLKELTAQIEGDRSHTEVQGWLRDLGRALGFDVWIAANDRGRPCGAGRLGDGCLDELPASIGESIGLDAVRLIDVLWLEPGDHRVAAAFEVEHTTSIYSGIVRLLDLALGAPEQAVRGLFLVAPDGREDEVRAQLARPAFRRTAALQFRYLPYGELDRHREAMARFGAGLKAVEAIARTLT